MLSMRQNGSSKQTNSATLTLQSDRAMVPVTKIREGQREGEKDAKTEREREGSVGVRVRKQKKKQV